MITRRPLLAAALLATPSIARAQGEWPLRPVRIIVPWPPGGSTDVLVRIYAELMQPILGQNLIIENRAGAGGNIGIDATAKATPDGYTMGIASVGHLVINNFLYSRLPYDPARELVPVGIAWDLPNVVVVSAQHNPSRSLADFTAWVRAKRGGEQLVHPAAKTFDFDVVEQAHQQHRAGQPERGRQISCGNNTHVGMVRVVTCSAVDELPDFRDQVDRQKVHGIEQEYPDKHRQRQRGH